MKKALAALAAFLLPLAAAAQGTVTLQNPLNVSSVPALIANILRAFIGIVGALALLVFIYGGFLWLTSRGDAGKVQGGKDAMKWAAIGLLVIFTSYALVRFVFKAITGTG